LAPGSFRIFGNQQATLSIDENTIKESILTLYPNPTKNSFSLSREVQSVVVFDITGKQVKQFAENTLKTNVFSVTDLTSGIYVVRIQDSENNVETKKVIIE
jgi:hypothetical protein